MTKTIIWATGSVFNRLEIIGYSDFEKCTLFQDDSMYLVDANYIKKFPKTSYSGRFPEKIRNEKIPYY